MSDSSNAKTGEGVYYNNPQNEALDIAAEDFGAASKSSEQSEGTSGQVTQKRKIIEYVNFTVEMKNFDKLIDDINAAVKQSGGYIEGSEIGGNSCYAADSRTAEFKIRIPQKKQTNFSD